jgi:hypothetical protein
MASGGVLSTTLVCQCSFAISALNRGRRRRSGTLSQVSRTENVSEDKSWQAVILEGFAALRKANLTYPLMNEIAEVFQSDLTPLRDEQLEQAAQ